MFKKFFFSIMLLVAAAATSQHEPGHVSASYPVFDKAEDLKLDEPKVEKVYPRGYKLPAVAELKRVHDDALRRHGRRMAALPIAAPTSFDCRAMGWVTPMQNQANCGSCWDVATCDQISSVFLKGGYKDIKISPQYFLDQCGPRNGACDGDWGTTVLNAVKDKGAPTEADYGPYTARQGTCKLKSGTKLLKISDWGFCTAGQQSGMSSTQDIKNAIVQFGPVSTAVAANSDWDGYRSGVMPFRKLTEWDVNHEVQIIGWDDGLTTTGTTAKGAFLVKNQWSEDWGGKGYCWIAYGSHQIGTEAAWVTVSALPPPPGPTPPDPPPPVPPGPNPPTPVTGFTGTISKVQEYKDGVVFGPERVVVTSSMPALEAYQGVTPATIAAVMKLFADIMTKQSREVIIGDILAIMMSLAPVEPAPIPEPMPQKNGRLSIPLPWSLAA